MAAKTANPEILTQTKRSASGMDSVGSIHGPAETVLVGSRRMLIRIREPVKLHLIARNANDYTLDGCITLTDHALT